MDLPGNSYNIIERGKHHETARQGNLTAQSWTLGGNGFFQDLYKNIRLAVQNFVDLAGLDDLRFYRESAKIQPCALLSFMHILVNLSSDLA